MLAKFKNSNNKLFFIFSLLHLKSSFMSLQFYPSAASSSSKSPTLNLVFLQFKSCKIVSSLNLYFIFFLRYLSTSELIGGPIVMQTLCTSRSANVQSRSLYIGLVSYHPSYRKTSSINFIQYLLLTISWTSIFTWCKMPNNNWVHNFIS